MTTLNEFLSRLPAERQGLIRARTAELLDEVRDLRTLRHELGVSQDAIGACLGVQQPRVSKFEANARELFSSLRSYMHALGAELEICARFADGKRVRIEQLCGAILEEADQGVADELHVWALQAVTRGSHEGFVFAEKSESPAHSSRLIKEALLRAYISTPAVSAWNDNGMVRGGNAAVAA